MTPHLAIVGAGPAGMAAAIEASERGCRVTVIDEAARPGGQIYRQASPNLPAQSYADRAEGERKKKLLERFERALRQIEYRPSTAAYAAFSNGELHIASSGRTEVLKPGAILLATGVREMAIPFPGWTLPGVMLAGGAQALLKSQHTLPGKRVVIAGCGPLPTVVAAQLVRAGAKVAALASLHPPSALLRYPAGLWQGRGIMLEGARYASSVLKAGVERLTRYVPVKAIGRDHVEAAILAKVTPDGKVVPGSEREIACDVLAVNYGFAANSELAAMAGAEMRKDSTSGWVPAVDERGATSLPWLFVAGDGAGLRGALVAEEDGMIAAVTAADFLGMAPGARAGKLAQAIELRRSHLAFQSAVRGLLRVPLPLWNITTASTIVCRCENVMLADISDALRANHRSPNAVKRNTRLGMGMCGGRTCMPSFAALSELTTGEPMQSLMTPRPMARPVTLGALAAQKPGTQP